MRIALAVRLDIVLTVRTATCIDSSNFPELIQQNYLRIILEETQ